MKKPNPINPNWLLQAIAFLCGPLLGGRLEKLEAETEQLRSDLKDTQNAVFHALKITGRADSYDGGNWAVLVVRTKGVDHAHMFRFGNRNPAAVMDLMYRFEKAGAETRLAKPLNKEPR